jgi:predicted nucleotidyltransferase
MRSNRPIDALFPKTRQHLLAAIFGQPERWWYMSELAQELKTSPSSLQRELKELVHSGILQRRQEGRRIYFKAEERLPFFAELKGLIEKTLGVVPAITDVLRRFGGDVRLAFIYGSVATQQEKALSDVDLCVVGAVGLSQLAPVLRRLERRFRREVNVSTYTPAEFAAKLNSGDHFLSSILKCEKLFVIGDADELERTAGEPASPAS